MRKELHTNPSLLHPYKQIFYCSKLDFSLSIYLLRFLDRGGLGMPTTYFSCTWFIAIKGNTVSFATINFGLEIKHEKTCLYISSQRKSSTNACGFIECHDFTLPPS